MRNLWKFLKGRYLTDRADSILVPALILAPVLGFCVGLCVETGKNAYIRSERVNMIQDSASAAVKLTDSRGSLDWRVVDRVVNEYEHSRFGAKKYSSADNSVLKYDDGQRETSEGKVFGSGTKDEAKACLIQDGQSYPQYKVTLDTVRGTQFDANGKPLNHPKTVTFTRTQPTLNALNISKPLNTDRDANGKAYIYRSVTVEVIDQTPNIMLGLAGIPCQKFDLNASAVTFSANSDIPTN